MLIDAVRCFMLNIVIVELFFNCYQIWTIFISSSLHSPRGQYAMVSFLITLVAQIGIQFNFSWILSIYSIYLAIGLGVWIYRRVYFYHRRLDAYGVNQTISHFETDKANANNTNNSNATFRPEKHSSKESAPASSASSSVSSLSANTNSLQRQRASAFRDFQTVLNVPRHNNRGALRTGEYALSLAHLSHVSKLIGSEDDFDEMHFQILATRRDVVNIVIRSLMISTASLLAYFR